MPSDSHGLQDVEAYGVQSASDGVSGLDGKARPLSSAMCASVAPCPACSRCDSVMSRLLEKQRMVDCEGHTPYKEPPCWRSVPGTGDVVVGGWRRPLARPCLPVSHWGARPGGAVDWFVSLPPATSKSVLESPRQSFEALSEICARHIQAADRRGGAIGARTSSEARMSRFSLSNEAPEFMFAS